MTNFTANVLVIASVLLLSWLLPSATLAQDFPVGPTEETPLPPQAVQFLRGLTLMLLPDSYTDDDDWGAEKRFQVGLDMKMDGLRLHTSRRWKDLNHGVWRRAEARLVDPKQHFQLGISLLPREEPDVPRYRVDAAMKLRVVGRQQQWNLGTRLYSISADATADLKMTADVSFRSDLISKDDRTRLQVLPHIETARVRLVNYRLNGISHAKGGVVRELGNAVEPIVQRAVRKQGDKLPGKINRSIQKKPERFQIPASILAFLRKKESTLSPSANTLDQLSPR